MAQSWKTADQAHTITVYVADLVTTDDGKVYRRQDLLPEKAKQDYQAPGKTLNGGN
jgi:hypothetical protein